MAKNLSDLFNFCSKSDVLGIFCLRKHFLLFLAEFESLMFHTNIVKITEKLNKPYRFLHNLHSFLLWGKVQLFDLFKNQ